MTPVHRTGFQPAAAGTPDLAFQRRLADVYARILAGRNYHDLAADLGVNHETLRRLVVTKSCNLKLLVSLGTHFDINLDWLLMGSGEPTRTDERRSHLARATPSEICSELAEKLAAGALPLHHTPQPARLSSAAGDSARAAGSYPENPAGRVSDPPT
jgi:hypothetical protein